MRLLDITIELMNICCGCPCNEDLFMGLLDITIESMNICLIA